MSNATAFGVEIPALGRADEVIELGAERGMTPAAGERPQEGMFLGMGPLPICCQDRADQALLRYRRNQFSQECSNAHLRDLRLQRQLADHLLSER